MRWSMVIFFTEPSRKISCGAWAPRHINVKADGTQMVGYFKSLSDLKFAKAKLCSCFL